MQSSTILTRAPRMSAALAISALVLLAACAPAASSPTAAPAKPAAQATTVPAKGAATTAPAKTEAKPAASPAGKTEAKPAEKAAAKPLSRTKAVVATVSNSWTVMMAPLLALDKGWWKEAGLTEAEVKVVGPGATHVAAVIGGSIDYSVNLNVEGTARANSKGDKIYGISGSTNKPNYALYAKGVDSVAGLKGKSIATDTPGGAAESLVIDIVQAKGLSGSDVTLVPVAGTIEERVKAMLTGATTAALGSVSDWPTLKTQGVNRLATLSEVFPDFQFALNVARGEVLEKNPDTTVAFFKGMIKAYQFIQDPKNNQEIAQLLKKHDIRVDDANFDELMQIQRELMTTDGSVNVKGTQVVLDRMVKDKQLPDGYKAEQLLRLNALEQAQKEMSIKK